MQVWVGFTDCDSETREWETGLDCVLVSNYDGQNRSGVHVANVTEPPVVVASEYDSYDRRSAVSSAPPFGSASSWEGEMSRSMAMTT